MRESAVRLIYEYFFGDRDKLEWNYKDAADFIISHNPDTKTLEQREAFQRLVNERFAKKSFV